MGNTNGQTSLNCLEFATIKTASALRLFGLGERVKKCKKTKPHTEHSIFLQYSYVLRKALAVISLIGNDLLPNVHISVTRNLIFWHDIETITKELQFRFVMFFSLTEGYRKQSCVRWVLKKESCLNKGILCW